MKPALSTADWRSSMIIYNAGFIAVYVIFALLYWHAYRQRTVLALSPMEEYETRGVVQEHLVMVGIGALALVLSIANLAAFAGIAYVLIAPAQMWLGTIHGRRRAALEHAVPESSLETAPSS